MTNSEPRPVAATLSSVFLSMLILCGCGDKGDPKQAEKERLISLWNDYVKLVTSRISEIEASVLVAEDTNLRVGKVQIVESDLQQTESLSNPIVGKISWSYTYDVKRVGLAYTEEYEFRVQLVPPPDDKSGWKIVSSEYRRNDVGTNKVDASRRMERGQWYPYKLPDDTDDSPDNPGHKWGFLINGSRKGKFANK